MRSLRSCPSSPLVRLALVVASLAVVTLALEAALRLAGARPRTATVLTTFVRPDPTTGWSGVPNARSRLTTADFDVLVSHGSDGFRSSSPAPSARQGRPDGQETVWFLGDSFGWGWGVADGHTYVDLLNQLDSGRRTYRNLALPGFSSVQELILLARLLATDRAPTAVVVHFIANDLEDNLACGGDLPRPCFAASAGGFELVAPPPTPRAGWRLRSWLQKRSLLYNWAHYYLRRAQEAAGMLLRRRRARPDSFAADPLAQTPDATQIAALRQAYRSIKELCNAHHVRLAIACELAGPVADAVRNVCRELSIDYLDLSGRWQAHLVQEGAEPLVFPRDPHYNAAGHRVLAEAIHAELARLWPVPGTR